MSDFIKTIKAEIRKTKGSKFLLGTFIAFGIAPAMGGVFIFLVQNPTLLAEGGGLATKMKAMNFSSDWNSYFMILTQAIGVGGILIFGFVISWIFGREYSDGTAKDLMSLPTSRTTIINSKFIVYAIWCISLVISNLVIGFIIGTILKIKPPLEGSFNVLLTEYFFTALFTIVSVLPVAFFAIWGKGYLTPLAFVALVVVFAQVIAATGNGNYFPWSIPGLYSGAGGEYKNQLNIASYSILFATSLIGYLSTVIHWNTADQTK